MIVEMAVSLTCHISLSTDVILAATIISGLSRTRIVDPPETLKHPVILPCCMYLLFNNPEIFFLRCVDGPKGHVSDLKFLS